MFATFKCALQKLRSPPPALSDVRLTYWTQHCRWCSFLVTCLWRTSQVLLSTLI